VLWLSLAGAHNFYKSGCFAVAAAFAHYGSANAAVLLLLMLLLACAGAHYYCESLDITRPFPSQQLASDPSWAFVWNRALSSPLRRVGLEGPNAVCPALLQVRGQRAGG
jgi:hypothetical protein